ncbi:MAG: hypothetical protein ACEY3E_01995 [Candidatus Tisiphia sp.]
MMNPPYHNKVPVNIICKADDLALQFTPPNNTVQLTTPSNALQFPVSNATDNTLQPSLITSNSNATLRFTDEQDVRPILGDDSEGSQE